MDIKKILTAIGIFLTLGSVFAATPSITMSVSTQPPGAPEIPHQLSFMFPLSYEAGAFQTIKICGKIGVPSSSPVQATLNIYTKLEGDTDLLQSKQIEVTGTLQGHAFSRPATNVYGDRYPSSGYATFVLSPGDYLNVCWILKVGTPTHEGKIRAYYYASVVGTNIVKTGYSDWVTIKQALPTVSGWNINVAIYGGAAALLVLALLKKLNIIRK